MESLARLGFDIVKHFQQIDNIENPTQTPINTARHEWPKAQFAAEFDRFELWAVNLGVFVSGHGSLDYRIRDADSIRDTLHRFMEDLNTSLQEGEAFCSPCFFSP